MDRSYHSAHAQRTVGALHHLLQPVGCGDHHIHCVRPIGHAASDAEATEPDAGHERATAQAERDSRPALQRPVSSVAGDHASLPGGRCQPFWVPGPDDRPDAHPDRPIPGFDPDTFLPPRQLGRIVGKAVHLDTGRPNILGRADRFSLSMAGPGRVRPQQTDFAGAGLRVHLGPAENDHAAVDRSAAIWQPGNDALDDALDDCLFLVHPAQRSVFVLDNVKCDRYSHPIFRNRRLGTPIPPVPQIRSGGGSGSSSPAIPRCVTGGDGRRWKRS